MQKFVINKDDSFFEAWPDIVRTDSGKLICVFTECKAHTDRENARLALCESVDRGRTWSQKRYLTEKGSNNDNFNCPRISKLRDGTLAVICDRVFGFDKYETAETYVWRGDSEGITWGKPEVYPFHGIVPDKLLQLKNGRLIISNHSGNTKTGRLEQHLWYSDDNGKTWSQRVTVASDNRYNLCEISILECENNTLVGFLRENSFNGYDVFKVISYDNGETWSEVYNTPIACGQRPVAGHLNDGRCMVTYRYLPGNAGSYQNIFAALLSGDELTVTDRKEVQIRTFPIDYDRNSSPDTGYTGWTQFDDGEIYVVNYIKDDFDKAQIRGYSIYPEDLILDN